MKTTQRTTKNEFSTIMNIRKIKDNLVITERIERNLKGEVVEININYEDQTGIYTGRDGKEHAQRDDVRYSFEVANRHGLEYPEIERVGWSTGWQDSLEGKLVEQKHRDAALKYFVKRKAALLG